MNPSTDLLLFDGVMPITLSIVRSDGAQQISIPRALPRPVDRVETETALVTLTRETRDWLIPADDSMAGVSPAPGDEIAAGSERWSIISVQRAVLGGVWRCTCRRVF